MGGVVTIQAAMARCWLAWATAVLLCSVFVVTILTVGAVVGDLTPTLWQYGLIGFIDFVLISSGAILHWRVLNRHKLPDRAVRPEGYLKARLLLWCGGLLPVLLSCVWSMVHNGYLLDFLMAMVFTFMVMWSWPTSRRMDRPPGFSRQDEALLEENEMLHVHPPASVPPDTA